MPGRVKKSTYTIRTTVDEIEGFGDAQKIKTDNKGRIIIRKTFDRKSFKQAF